jgi:hypothetical protein
MHNPAPFADDPLSSQAIFASEEQLLGIHPIMMVPPLLSTSTSLEQLLGIHLIMMVPPLLSTSTSFPDVQHIHSQMDIDSFPQPLLSSFPLHSAAIYQCHVFDSSTENMCLGNLLLFTPLLVFLRCLITFFYL